jgi:hypothetical protein
MDPFNQQMCSQACPCTKSSKAWSQFNSLSEKELNVFERSKAEPQREVSDNMPEPVNKPLIWIDNLEMGFYSLEKCIDFWVEKAGDI